MRDPIDPKWALVAGTALALAFPVTAPGDTRQAFGMWDTRAPLPDERTEVSVTTDGERLYLAGGFEQAGPDEAGAPRAVYAYDPGDDAWSHLTDLPEGVNHAGLEHIDGKLYLVGGFYENTFDAIDNLRIYDLDADEWRDGAPLPTARGALAVAVYDGHIHAFGGVDADGENTPAHEIYDPEADSWSTAADLPTPRDHHGAVAVDDEIVVLAGRDDTSYTLTVNEIYEVGDDTWRTGADVPTGRSGVAVVEFDGWVYIVGGETFSPDKTFDEAERYHPGDDRWEILPSMPTARHGLDAAVLDRWIHVVAGGPDAGFAFSDVNERLAPER